MVHGFARRGDYLRGSFITPADRSTRFPAPDPFGTAAFPLFWPASTGSVEEAISAGTEAQPEWRETPISKRIRTLRALPDAVDELAGTISARLTAETGISPWEARAEVAAAIRQMDFLLGEAPKALGGLSNPSVIGTSTRVPWGVLAILAPFTHSVFLSLMQALAGLLAGNAVILKPSSLTPGCGQLVAEALSRTRLPRGVFALVQGPRHPIGQALLHHPGVHKLLVSCRPSTAETLESSSSRSRLLLRTSCRSTAGVFADAPLDRAVLEVTLGAFLSSGQRCNGTARVVVHRDVASPFLSRLKAATLSLRSAPREPSLTPDSFFLGPLANPRDQERCQAFTHSLRQQGRPILVGEEDSHEPGRGNFVAPFIYMAGESPPGASGELVEDLVGPILEVGIADGDEEILKRCASPRALSASVFTRDEALFHRSLSLLPQGSVNWNRATVVSSGRLPAAGPGAFPGSGDGHADLLRSLSRAQAHLVGNGEEPLLEEFPPGMEWRGNGVSDGMNLKWGTEGSTEERAARVVASGQRVRASFSDQS